MKQLFLLFLVVGVASLFSCESELEDENTCNINVLAVTASVKINGENACYSNGGLGFNNTSNMMSLNLFGATGGFGGQINVQFTIPDQGFQFNESYPVASGEYSNAVPVTGGTIILVEDNYPTDPNLLQYKGMIDLTFQSAGSGNIINVTGDFSFERP